MPEPQVIEPDFFEVIGTQRAMRRLKPDPVPEAYIKKIIWAATRAPSGGNRQGWRWLVVTDPASKKQIQQWYNELWSEATASGYGAGAGLPEDERLSNERVMKSATYLAEHMHEVPVLIFACSLTGGGDIVSGSSIYPAVQNLMLAARALGVSSLFTTFFFLRREQIREILGIPPRIFMECAVFLGYGAEKLGAPRRLPVEKVSHANRWGTPYVRES